MFPKCRRNKQTTDRKRCRFIAAFLVMSIIMFAAFSLQPQRCLAEDDERDRTPYLVDWGIYDESTGSLISLTDSGVVGQDSTEVTFFLRFDHNVAEPTVSDLNCSLVSIASNNGMPVDSYAWVKDTQLEFQYRQCIFITASGIDPTGYYHISVAPGITAKNGFTNFAGESLFFSFPSSGIGDDPVPGEDPGTGDGEGGNEPADPPSDPEEGGGGNEPADPPLDPEEGEGGKTEPEDPPSDPEEDDGREEEPVKPEEEEEKEDEPEEKPAKPEEEETTSDPAEEGNEPEEKPADPAVTAEEDETTPENQPTQEQQIAENEEEKTEPETTPEIKPEQTADAQTDRQKHTGEEKTETQKTGAAVERPKVVKPAARTEAEADRIGYLLDKGAFAGSAAESPSEMQNPDEASASGGNGPGSQAAWLLIVFAGMILAAGAVFEEISFRRRLRRR